MKEYTPKQIRQLEANPYTFKVTNKRIFFTKKFKEDFWIQYQAGKTPRSIIEDFGYDLSTFGQKQIDSIVQKIKQQALSGEGFSEGQNRRNRVKIKSQEIPEENPKSLEQMQHELLYLRQEVEFLKKIIKADVGVRCRRI